MLVTRKINATIRLDSSNKSQGLEVEYITRMMPRTVSDFPPFASGISSWQDLMTEWASRETGCGWNGKNEWLKVDGGHFIREKKEKFMNREVVFGLNGRQRRKQIFFFPGNGSEYKALREFSKFSA